MYFDNRCGAPDDFIESLKKAWKKSVLLAEQELMLHTEPNPHVIIIDKDPDPTPPDETFSLNAVSRNLQMLMEEIKGSHDIENKEKIAERLRLLWLHLIGELKSDGLFSPNELIHEITDLFHNNDLSPDFFSKDKRYVLWKQIVHAIPLIDYPMENAGFYRLSDLTITICYETIRQPLDQQHVNEYGEYVLSHEFFHALHHQTMENTPHSKLNWTSRSHPAMVRRRAVTESLAEYFAWSYARRHLSRYVQQKGRSAALSHPFPSWGYAGAEIIDHYGHEFYLYQEHALNPFFKAVFFSSLIDTEKGYQILKKEQVEFDSRLKMPFRKHALGSIQSGSVSRSQGILTVTRSFYNGWNRGKQRANETQSFKIQPGTTIQIKNDFIISIVDVSQDNVLYVAESLNFPIQDPKVQQRAFYHDTHDMGYMMDAGGYTIEFTPAN